MRSASWEKLISAYLDGETSDAERLAIEKRLTRQAELARTLEQFEAISRALSGLPREAVDSHFLTDFRTHVERQVDRLRRGDRLRQRLETVADLALAAYLDGELSPKGARQVERFLLDRPYYRQRLREMERVQSALRRLPRVAAPQAAIRWTMENLHWSEPPVHTDPALAVLERVPAPPGVLEEVIARLRREVRRKEDEFLVHAERDSSMGLPTISLPHKPRSRWSRRLLRVVSFAAAVVIGVWAVDELRSRAHRFQGPRASELALANSSPSRPILATDTNSTRLPADPVRRADASGAGETVPADPPQASGRPHDSHPEPTQLVSLVHWWLAPNPSHAVPSATPVASRALAESGAVSAEDASPESVWGLDHQVITLECADPGAMRERLLLVCDHHHVAVVGQHPASSGANLVLSAHPTRWRSLLHELRQAELDRRLVARVRIRALEPHDPLGLSASASAPITSPLLGEMSSSDPDQVTLTIELRPE